MLELKCLNRWGIIKIKVTYNRTMLELKSSFLVNSGKVKKYKTHYTVGYSASYAYIVEFGRKIGTMPPVSALIPWVKKKLRINKH